MQVETVKQGDSVLHVVALYRKPYYGNEWIAKVYDFDENYVYDRVFCDVYKRDWTRSGRNGTTYFILKGEGYYICNEPKVGRYFLHWDGQSDRMVEVDEEDVAMFLKKQRIQTEVSLTKDQEEKLKELLNKKHAVFIIDQANEKYSVIRCLDTYYLELYLSNKQKSILSEYLQVQIPHISEEQKDAVHFKISKHMRNFLIAVKEDCKKRETQKLFDKLFEKPDEQKIATQQENNSSIIDGPGI